MSKNKFTGVFAITVWVFISFVSAQTSSPSKKFKIMDNSFFIEEAFNQEAGVVQHISSLLRHWGPKNDPNGWGFGFTQEWPLGGMRHQFSYTLTHSTIDGVRSGMGDSLLNYRYQAATEEVHGFAMAPRLSLVVPTGREGLILPSGEREGALGSGSTGLQANLPISKQFSDLYLHFNAGGTWFPGSRSGLKSYQAGGSAIWQLHPRLNLMTELVALAEGSKVSSHTRWEYPVLAIPGFRSALDVGSTQLVWGIGVPLSLTGAAPSRGLFLYFSVEHPFR
jgi:hypothetical protein